MIVVKAVLAIGLWGVAVIGWLGVRLGWPMRALAMVAAFTLIAALPLTDEVGFALVGGLRRAPVAAVAPPVSGCLMVGATAIVLAGQGFSLCWEHSVEKVEWRETLAGHGRRPAP